MKTKTSHLSGIHENDSGVDAAYRHAPKWVTSGAPLEPRGCVLKWYALHAKDHPVPGRIARWARAHLLATPLEARGLGFVVLHRCGKEFYFLIVGTWRNSNELWQSVYYKDGRPRPSSRSFRARASTSPHSACGSWPPSRTSSRRGGATSDPRAAPPTPGRGCPILLTARCDVLWAERQGQGQSLRDW